MIKVVLVDQDPIIVLECDKCHATLLYTVVVEKPFKLPTPTAMRVLRTFGQKAGWLHVLAPADDDGPVDLCPACYALPPEA